MAFGASEQPDSGSAPIRIAVLHPEFRMHRMKGDVIDRDGVRDAVEYVPGDRRARRSSCAGRTAASPEEGGSTAGPNWYATGRLSPAGATLSLASSP